MNPGGAGLSARELRRRAGRIRLLAMDVDGVLTDGTILILDGGEELKLWNVKDRVGFFTLMKFGDRFPVAWITGRKSKQVRVRAKEIGVKALYQHCDHKGRALEETLKSLGLAREQCLFIGDDLVDIPAFRAAGLALCPADAHPSVRELCHGVTAAAGGRGAVREVIDFVLDAQGLTKDVEALYANPRRRPNP
jgi:3-deoxy-D-manno-octulosonate 8-phosphate phosphatase (KDO 8-P phosphatase)